MLEALSFEFMRNALFAGLLAAIACGTIGTLIVVNRMVFLAGGIAHAAYGGVGLAFYAGKPVLPTTIAFSLLIASFMSWITFKRPTRADTYVGIIWAAGMAFGIILMDLTPGYNSDLMSYLFGSILAVPIEDVQLMILLDILIIATIGICYKGFSAIGFDPEFARSRGIPVRRLHFTMILLMAASIVIIIRVVGLILVIALLTIPPHIVEKRTNSLKKMMFHSSLLSVVFCIAGISVSYHFNISSGASIIAVTTLAFILDNVVLQGIKKRSRSRINASE